MLGVFKHSSVNCFHSIFSGQIISLSKVNATDITKALLFCFSILTNNVSTNYSTWYSELHKIIQKHDFKYSSILTSGGSKIRTSP